MPSSVIAIVALMFTLFGMIFATSSVSVGAKDPNDSFIFSAVLSAFGLILGVAFFLILVD